MLFKLNPRILRIPVILNLFQVLEDCLTGAAVLPPRPLGTPPGEGNFEKFFLMVVDFTSPGLVLLITFYLIDAIDAVFCVSFPGSFGSLSS